MKYGVFRSRSEAIRELVRLGIENLAPVSEVLKAVKMLFEVERKKGEIPVDLSRAIKQLLAERERWAMSILVL